MPTQDTITIPRELGEWLDNLALSPRDSTGVGPGRYTPKAAHGILRDSLDAKTDAGPEAATSTDWGRAQDRRIAQLTEDREHGEARESKLRQMLAAEKAQHSEDLATIEDELTAALAARSAKAGLERDVWIDRTTFTPATNEVVIRVIIEQPPLTPTTTPEQNASS